MTKVDWIKIRVEYETTGLAYRKLAAKHGVSFNTLQIVAKREGWVKSKNKTQDKIMAKTRQKVVVKEANRNARIASLADKLASKLEKAIEQTEMYIVTNKTKTKTVTYDNSIAKPTKEVTVEVEAKDIVDGIVDRQGLKFLTAALKDIHDIQVVATEKLALERKKLDQDDGPNDGVFIIHPPKPEGIDDETD